MMLRGPDSIQPEAVAPFVTFTMDSDVTSSLRNLVLVVAVLDVVQQLT